MLQVFLPRPTFLFALDALPHVCVPRPNFLIDLDASLLKLMP